MSMTKKIFKKIINDITIIISNSDDKNDTKHASNVLKLVRKLKPSADYVLQIAAYGHDIDRGLPHRKRFKDYNGDYDVYKKAHSIQGAKEIIKILKKYDIPQETIDKIKKLVEKHEFGGDKESNILKDADSIALIKYDLANYIKKHSKKESLSKINWMYKRMNSPKAKQIAKPFYNQAIKKLRIYES